MSLKIKIPILPVRRTESHVGNLRDSSDNDYRVKDSSKVIVSGNDESRNSDIGKIDPVVMSSPSPVGEKHRKVINRHYGCKRCEFLTFSAREFLLHQRDIHGGKFAIFLCEMCDYASKWKCKVQRHRSMIHKSTTDYEELKIDVADTPSPTLKIPEIPKQKDMVAKKLFSRSKSNSESVLTTTLLSDNSVDHHSMNSETMSKASFMSCMSLTAKSEMIISESKYSENMNENPASTNVETAAVEGKCDPPHPYHNIDPEKYVQIFEDVGQESQFQCKICNYLHPGKYQVKKHIRLKHINARILRCSVETCKFATYDRSELMRHKSIHPDSALQCKSCDYTTYLRPNLERHISNHGRENSTYKCSKCNYGSCKLGALHRHVEEHHRTGEGYPEINVLMKKGNSTVILKAKQVPSRKKIKVENPQINSQDESKYEASSSKLKQILLAPVKSTTTTQSSKPFGADVNSITDPVVDSKQTLQDEKDSDELGFLCDLCDQMFKRASDLDDHMQNHHNIGLADYMGTRTNTSLSIGGSDNDASVQPLDLSVKHDDDGHMIFPENTDDPNLADRKEKRAIKCAHCPYIAKVPWDMKRHMNVHIPSTQRFYCQLCPRHYKYSGDLTVHMKKAHNRTRSQNDRTDSNFRNFNVQRNRSSTGEYLCKVCGYAAKYITELKKHNRTHTKAKPFMCEFCDYRTAWKGDLKRHLEKYHFEKLGKDEDKLREILMRCEMNIEDTLPGNESLDEFLKSTPKKRSRLKTREALSTPVIKTEPLDDDYMDSTPSVTPLKQNSKSTSCKKSVPLSMVSGKKSVPLSMVSSVTASPSTTHKRKSSTPQKLLVDPEGNGSVIESPTKSPGNVVQCNLCSYKTAQTARLKFHMMAHKNLKLYKCLICGHRSNWMWDVAKHIKARHQRPRHGNMIMLSEDEARSTIADYLARNHKQSHLRLKIATVPKSKSSDITSLPALHTPPQSVSSKIDLTTSDTSSTTSSMSTTSSTTSQQEATLNLRRFKCSVCGHRSNWKWVIKKHLKVNHGDPHGLIIHLSEEEARSSLPANLTPGMKQSTIDKYSSNPTLNGKLAPEEPCHAAVSDGNVSSSPHCSSTLSSATNSKNLPILKMPSLSKILQTSTSFKSPTVDSQKLKRFKCSCCHYRSNYRSDIQRHIYRSHKKDGEVIVLSPHEARETLPAYVAAYSSGKYKPKLRIKSLPEDHNILDSSIDVSENSDGMNTSAISLSDSLHSSVPEEENGKNDVEMMSADESSSVPVEFGNNEQMDTNLVEHEKSGVNVDENVNLIDNQVPGKDRDRHDSGKDSDFTPDHSYTKSAEKEEECLTSKIKKRMWKCSQCIFRHRDKTVVIRHLRSHAQNSNCAYSCAICGYASDYRSAVYRHVRTKHNATDYSTCKENIIYTKDDKEPHDDDIHNLAKKSPKSPGPPTLIASTPLKPGDEETNKLQSPGPSGRDMPKLFKSTAVSDRPWRCKLCGARSNWRYVITRHLREKHHTEKIEENHERLPLIPDFENKKEPLEPGILYPIGPDGNDIIMPGDEEPQYTNAIMEPLKSPLISHNTSGGRLYECSFCPYKTHKRGHLETHSKFHSPRPGHEVKCLHCPYYATSLRVVGQHMKLHKTAELNASPRAAALRCGADLSGVKYCAELKEHTNYAGVCATPPGRERRYYECPQCPYVTRSKTDFLYHKQFHRKRTVGPSLTCSKCDYCTTHRRFLTQHMKVHAAGYKDNKILQYGNDAKPHISNDSATSSPAKSDISESRLDYDPAELSGFKHDIIMSKITSATLSSLPEDDSPNKHPFNRTASNSVDKMIRTMSDGTMRKLHKCTKCPYTNMRLNNLKLHMKMHRRREGPNMFKCPHCEYYVGNKGLLGHHQKVHTAQYQLEINDMLEGDVLSSDGSDDTKLELKSGSLPFIIKKDCMTGDSYVEPFQPRKYCCDKCPYGSTKKSQLEKHMHLHGSKQRHTCEFCDYSVPLNSLLTQHRKLHFQPNQNLLATQSLQNLSRLPELPADVAAGMLVNSSLTNNLEDRLAHFTGIHDHLDLCENGIPDDTKKIYSCDRCPYSNMKRDQLLDHIKFHVIRSEHQCPYCDFSVEIKNMLTDHVQVHFCPILPDSSEVSKTDDNNIDDNIKATHETVPNTLTLLNVPKVDVAKDQNGNVASESSSVETYKNDDNGINKSMQLEESSNDSATSINGPNGEVQLNKSSDSSESLMVMESVDESVPPYLNESTEGDISDRANTTSSDIFKPLSDDKDGVLERSELQADVLKTNEISENTVVSMDIDEVKTESEDVKNTDMVVSPDEKSEDMVTVAEKVSKVGTDGDKLPIPLCRETENEPRRKSDSDDAELICQYCERLFQSKAQHSRHEMQHLIGSHF